jgi:uncharacterized protein (DUF4213/DUF364 family)
MVLDETIQLLRDLHGQGLDELRIERIVIGIFFTGVKLSDGSAGVVYTPTAEIHTRDNRDMAIDRPAPRTLKGISVRDVLERNDASVMDRTVRLVVANALSAPFLTADRYAVWYDSDVLDHIDLHGIVKVGMVGAIRPFLQRFREMPDIDVKVIEQKKESLKVDELKYYVPAEEAANVLPTCDVVVITGAAVANDTVDELLGWTKPGAQVIVTGPTASILPDALFRRNVSVVSGIAVTDADLALDMLAEGVIAYYLFKKCVTKINITRDGGGISGPLTGSQQTDQHMRRRS